jgi:sulfite reductase (NADPH) flavoprotein alpha-component
MNHVPTLPPNAPFTPEQRAWLNGFLAGILYDRGAVAESLEATPAARKVPLLVAFGSQTGSAEGLARRFAKEAVPKGFAPTLCELNQVTAGLLAKERLAILITSTWGDGDPPDNAAAFWSWLGAEAAPRLEQLQFAVLGLGDKNYADFCGASKKFDTRLEALGAKRLTARGECDVDFEAAAKAWLEGLWIPLQDAAAGLRAGDGRAGCPQPAAIENGGPPTAERRAEDSAPHPPADYSRANPFPARLKTNRRLNRDGSAKDTRHFEIVLEGSGLSYEVGDALGVTPANCPVLVEELLATLGFKGEESVKTPADQDTPLHDALLRHYAVTQPTTELLQAAAGRGQNAGLLALLAPDRKSELDQWLFGRDVVDVLRECPGARFTPAEFVGCLRRLQPRLYSISSSPKAHPGEVHLTVAAVRYEAHGRVKKGVASCWLADRVVLNESPVPVFIQPSHGFRLPADGNTPVIMVGPGTGVAPFRAFLEERRAAGARGRNWLFFGDQCRATDFLYEEELTAMQADGHLTRLDLAFSRDQREKIYVQDRMREVAAELWSWLEAGAHFYVCGDAKRMAKDVDAALHEVIAKAGGRTPAQAAEYVARLKTEKRYQRDVY